MELRDFHRFFFGVINSSELLSKGLTYESRIRFEDETAKYRIGDRRYSPNRQLVNEIIVTRSIEFFELYLLHMLRLIFEEHPNTVMQEKENVTEADFENPDEYFFFIAERKLHQLSYKPLRDLREYFKEKTKLDIFENNNLYETAMLGIQIRNLIAHNDCRVDARFIKQVSVLSLPPLAELGTRYILLDEWVTTLSAALDHVVFQYDEKVSAVLKLRTMNRMSSFLFRD